ncbi:MAG: hypothetical protein IPM54_39565 [Polyangiaceae bacterium]|nr:hypothetical protein [Polyangiaceae bacterium]
MEQSTTAVDLIRSCNLMLQGREHRVCPSRGALVFIVSKGVPLFFSFRGQHAPVLTRAAFGAWFVATVAGLGGVIEGRSWAKWLEAARIAAAPVVVFLIGL